MNSLVVFLQAAEGPAGGAWGTIAMFGLIIVVFYFFMIRPQQKKQKAVQEARQAMKVGDKIITAGGVHGKIKEIGETYFIIEIAESVRIKIDKASVFAVSEGSPKA
ncbi:MULTISPECIES: preprotein translocase subunit YajC [unclassified Dysgonomonas]|uniref:preprotein translocase subunit YajC n=1 Tax=unclassified Dysgonomonas TaxID=2630389 RepID=UPI0006824340|nr:MULTISPECIES: preprotein translocase subunit YajC [unclassified Dysgonomonas]MBD8348288.1 preprotein translocase subunit YajC [Dysgonomonas sp. HGC4]MBF0575430.1 preprotein translocase subunit YajC [Dysgonomonas sp. GY617]